MKNRCPKSAPTNNENNKFNNILDEQCSPLQNTGITLIALIITIILLLILAGVTIHFTLGENGIIKNAEIAGNKYKHSEENEVQTLNQVNRYITNRGSISEESNQSTPTGIKIDTHYYSVWQNVTTSEEITTMTAAEGVNAKDPENKIDEYIEFSNEKGFVIKKSGWYFVDMLASVTASNNSTANVILRFYYNGQTLARARCMSYNNIQGDDMNSFSIYLNKNDAVYFSTTGATGTATNRNATGCIMPMF